MDKFLNAAGIFFLAVLCLILFLVFLFAAVCLSSPKIIIKYRDKPEISASVWFIRFNVTKFLSRPKKEKKPQIHHFDGTLFGELPEKADKRKEKNKKKTANVNNSPAKSQSSGSDEKEKKPLGETVSAVLELIADILSDIKEPLKKILTVDIKRLYVTAASDDPHKTAILFGNLNTAMGTLIFVCRKFAALHIDEENAGVYSDFLSDKPALDAHIVLTLSFRHIISCGFKAIMRFIKSK